LAESVLGDQDLKGLNRETRTATEVEAHNAAGIAYMRIGQYLAAEGNQRASYWDSAEKHFSLALDLHPQDVRVLDNLSTLRLIQACDAIKQQKKADVQRFSHLAREAAETAISRHPRDRFRWQRLAKSLALLGEVEAAKTAVDKILDFPGEITPHQVEKLKRAIDPLDTNVLCEGLSS
jgi:tetratricopeptide (TPR) repeat protein